MPEAIVKALNSVLYWRPRRNRPRTVYYYRDGNRLIEGLMAVVIAEGLLIAGLILALVIVLGRLRLPG